MALIQFMELKGIEQELYIKILSCKAENKGYTAATIGYFIDEEAAKDRQNAVEVQTISFMAVPNQDIFAQAYDCAKERPEFKDAEDC